MPRLARGVPGSPSSTYVSRVALRCVFLSRIERGSGSYVGGRANAYVRTHHASLAFPLTLGMKSCSFVPEAGRLAGNTSLRIAGHRIVKWHRGQPELSKRLVAKAGGELACSYLSHG